MRFCGACGNSRIPPAQKYSGSQAPGNRLHLQQVVDNALHETERVYALMKRLCDSHPELAATPERKAAPESQAGRAKGRVPGVMFASESERPADEYQPTDVRKPSR